MRAQLDEDELVLLLEVGAMAQMGECELELVQLFVASKETLNVVSLRLVAGHHLVVSRHLVVLVVFPACRLCGSVAVPSLIQYHERLHVHDHHG